MKAITIRLTEDELEVLRNIKEAGFASIAEVIKCAALSYASAAPEPIGIPEKVQSASQDCRSASILRPINSTNKYA